MKLVTAYLTDGGIPDGWTPQNLDWLAKTHRRIAVAKGPTGPLSSERSAFHIRWAVLCEDLLESHFGNNH